MDAVIERLVACFERGELSRRQMIAGVAARPPVPGRRTAERLNGRGTAPASDSLSRGRDKIEHIFELQK